MLNLSILLRVAEAPLMDGAGVSEYPLSRIPFYVITKSIRAPWLVNQLWVGAGKPTGKPRVF